MRVPNLLSFLVLAAATTGMCAVPSPGARLDPFDPAPSPTTRNDDPAPATPKRRRKRRRQRRRR